MIKVNLKAQRVIGVVGLAFFLSSGYGWVTEKCTPTTCDSATTVRCSNFGPGWRKCDCKAGYARPNDNATACVSLTQASVNPCAPNNGAGPCDPKSTNCTVGSNPPKAFCNCKPGYIKVNDTMCAVPPPPAPAPPPPAPAPTPAPSDNYLKFNITSTGLVIDTKGSSCLNPNVTMGPSFLNQDVYLTNCSFFGNIGISLGSIPQSALSGELNSHGFELALASGRYLVQMQRYPGLNCLSRKGDYFIIDVCSSDGVTREPSVLFEYDGNTLYSVATGKRCKLTVANPDAVVNSPQKLTVEPSCLQSAQAAPAAPAAPQVTLGSVSGKDYCFGKKDLTASDIANLRTAIGNPALSTGSLSILTVAACTDASAINGGAVDSVGLTLNGIQGKYVAFDPSFQAPDNKNISSSIDASGVNLPMLLGSQADLSAMYGGVPPLSLYTSTSGKKYYAVGAPNNDPSRECIATTDGASMQIVLCKTLP